MLDVILLENNGFEFFCQSLYWRCCTLRCFFKMNNFPFCSLGWNLDGTKTRKGRFDFHISSIFKLKIYKTTVMNSSEKIYSINILCAPLTENNAVWLRVLMFCAKLKIWKAKSSSQKGKSYFFYRMFANWAHVNEATSVVHVSENFFSSNCSKLTVECDWNGKSSRNIQNLGFFKKSRLVFRKNILNFFKIAKASNFALECVSIGNI